MVGSGVARKRDHKAEYAARKAAAKRRGYESVRETRRARKVLSLPRRRHTPPKRVLERYDSSLIDVIEPSQSVGRLRREARKWSDAHSRVDRSKYRDDMTNKELRAYHKAFVEPPKGVSRRKKARAKRQRIKEYIMSTYDMTEEEWQAAYELVPV